MHKLTSFFHITQWVILSSLIVSAGLLFSPSLSTAEEIPGPDQNYRNCAELQKHLNDNNPEDKYEGFEKASLMRRNLTYGGQYIVFCNGGIVRDGGLGTLCRGYIAYSYARIQSTSRYYAGWGRTKGLPNENHTGQENYCRWLK